MGTTRVWLDMSGREIYGRAIRIDLKDCTVAVYLSIGKESSWSLICMPKFGQGGWSTVFMG